VRALLTSASGDWKTCILAAYTTGARLSDVVGMRWADLDMAKGVWTYVQGKTGERTETPMHPDLHGHLESIAGDEPAEFVMPTLAGKGTGGCNGLSIQFSKIMRSAGITQDREDQKSGRSFASLSFHSLRHSFESHLADAGVSAETRRELAGRADEAVQRGYTHLQLATMRQAVEKLGRVL
jgi:integrase